MSRRRTVDPLAAALRERRVAMGWTQAEMAERLRVPQSRIGEVEIGVHSPLLATVRKFAEELDCDVVLVPRSEPPPQITDEMVGLRPERKALRDKAREMYQRGMAVRLIAQRLNVSERTIQRWKSTWTDGETFTPPDEGAA